MATESKPPLHIVEFHAENLKRIKVARIAPDGAVIALSGANGSGKSSILDAIRYALAGKGAIDPQPVRMGEENATVRLDLGEVVITRTFEKDGKTEVEIRSASGAKFPSPQKMLEELMGKSALIFDQTAFERMTPKQQLEELQKVVSLPVTISVLRREISEAYDRRTDVNRQVRDLEGKVRALTVRIPTGYSPDSPEFAQIETKPILARLEQLGALEREAQAELSRRERLEREAELQADAARKRREDAARMIAEAEELERLAAEGHAAVAALGPIPRPPDASEIRAELERAQKRNDELFEIFNRHELEQTLKEKAAQAEQLTAAIEGAEEEVRQQVAALKMPVEGLGFGDDGILLHGLPLEQASAAERLRVALGLTMAANPRLRIVLIKDGSLLDPKSRELVAQMAAERQYQVWVEYVDTTGGVGIVLEDGEIKQVNR